MDHSPDQSKQNRGHQTGSTQRQVIKKEIKLEAVDDSHDTILRLMCNHPDHRSGQSQGQLQEFQQRIQDLERKGAEKDKKIANLTSNAEALK
ncbi:hypothetical protein DAPPUDRAFT_272102, partial [Daphnia pulex]